MTTQEQQIMLFCTEFGSIDLNLPESAKNEIMNQIVLKYPQGAISFFRIAFKKVISNLNPKFDKYRVILKNLKEKKRISFF